MSRMAFDPCLIGGSEKTELLIGEPESRNECGAIGSIGHGTFAARNACGWTEPSISALSFGNIEHFDTHQARSINSLAVWREKQPRLPAAPDGKNLEQ